MQTVQKNQTIIHSLLILLFQSCIFINTYMNNKLNRNYLYPNLSKSPKLNKLSLSDTFQPKKSDFIIQNKKLYNRNHNHILSDQKKTQSTELDSWKSKTTTKICTKVQDISFEKYKSKMKRLSTQPNSSLNNIDVNGSEKISQKKCILNIQINLIEKHSLQLKKILEKLKRYERQQTQNIQKIVLQYYHKDLQIQQEIQKINGNLKKQCYLTINLERIFIISLIEFCMNSPLKLNIFLIRDYLKKLIDQYQNINSCCYQKTQNLPNLDSFSSKLKYKSRNHMLIIKAQNFKLFEEIKKVTSKLEIYQSLKEVFDNSKSSNPKDFWYLLKEYYAYHLTLANLDRTTALKQSYWPLVTCPEPYLPKTQLENYTLVLDLDQTLIHYTENGQVLIRPFANEFIKSMKDYYQIIIFTAGMPDYADFILNHLEEKHHIAYKLYRYHTTRIQNQKSIKDLSRLGRPLQKVILIDNLKQNYSKQIYNGIEIKSWYGDAQDKQLQRIMKHLEVIIEKKMDVRQYIRKVIH